MEEDTTKLNNNCVFIEWLKNNDKENIDEKIWSETKL